MSHRRFFVSKTDVGTSKSREVIFNMDSLNYVRIKYKDRELKLLIDTGASISVIFLEHVGKSQSVDHSESIIINGIAGSARSSGSVCMSLEADGTVLTHKFFLIAAFDDSIHGVLGSDFFESYGAVIDYSLFTISLFVCNKSVVLPIQSNHCLLYTSDAADD